MEKEHLITFEDGNTKKSLKQIGKTKKRVLKFYTLKKVFSDTTFSSTILDKNKRISFSK